MSAPEYVHGIRNAEDLIHLPGTPWVVASQHIFDRFAVPQKFGMGPLKAIRVDTREVHTLYPAPDSQVDWDRECYPDRASPAEIFSPVGLNAQSLGEGQFRLYVANHGGGKSVEVLDVRVHGPQLHASWRGSIRVPEELGVWPNAVVPLPEGAVALSGVGVAIWRPGMGWKAIESRKAKSSNGVEVSRDGLWLFVADTGSRSVVRIALATGDEQTIADHLDCFSDNLRWGEDGQLYLAGPYWPEGTALEALFKKPICDVGFAIVQIDPQTLASKTVFRCDGIPGVFGAATTAQQIGHAFWIGTVLGDRIMILPIASDASR